MLRTASIKLSVGQEEATLLESLREEYTTACNLLVSEVIKSRCWNRVVLHTLTYSK